MTAWKDDYSVENEVIDRQHRFLITTANELYAACSRGGIIEKVALMKTIQGAVSYAKTHFADEEALMRKADYPDLPAHKKEHEDFVAEVIRQVKGFEGNANPDAGDFARFLRNWIMNHIAGSDRGYIPYLQSAAPKQ